MTTLDRASNGLWRCSDAADLKRWLEGTPTQHYSRQIEAFLAAFYKHLGNPTSDERAWERLGEAWITRQVRDCLVSLGEGRTWREPREAPISGFAPPLRRVLPETMLVAGEAGLAPAAAPPVRETPRRVIALLTARGAPPRVQELFGRLGQEIGNRNFRVVSAAVGPAEQALLKALGDEGLKYARVVLGEGQKPPTLPGIRPVPLRDIPALERDAKARLAEWFPAWRGDDEDRAALERDLALLLSADFVLAWSEDGRELGRLSLPLLAAHQQGVPVLNLGAGGSTLERALATLDAWSQDA